MAALVLIENKSTNVSNSRVLEFVNSVFGERMHLKRVESLANAAIGLLHSEKLILHKIGEGLALAKGTDKKHATKQVDRLLSNKKFDIWDACIDWAPYIIGEKTEIFVSMDWTDFDADGHSTIALNLITDHGRATPILWKTVEKSSLKNNRARYEDQILSRLKDVISENVRVTILADRGFADQKFFKFIGEELEFFYIIRIRSNTYITDKHDVKQYARDWLRADGFIKCLDDVKVTNEKFEASKFVCTQQKDMKDPWYLVSNCGDLTGKDIVKYYGKRWTIEPYFRDIKDQRFGMGLESTHISTPDRRDRLFFISSICVALLTLLGAAGESIGFDRKLKVNTVKRRTHSLLRQGIFYYKFLINFTHAEQSNLMRTFNELLAKQQIWTGIFMSI